MLIWLAPLLLSCVVHSQRTPPFAFNSTAAARGNSSRWETPPPRLELWRLPGLDDAYTYLPTLRKQAAALAARGFKASNASNARSYNRPQASSKAHTALHPGVGYISLNYTARLHPDLVHLDEFAALLRELNASWECAAGPSGTTLNTLRLASPPNASSMQDAGVVVAYLAGRLAAPNATLAWGPALLDMGAQLWGASCDAPLVNRSTEPFFQVHSVGVQAGSSAGSLALTMLLEPCPPLRLFSHIKMATRVMGNETRAKREFPRAPTAPQGRRNLAPNPDPTLTGTGNQVTTRYVVSAFKWNYASPGVASVSPKQLLSDVPATALGCVDCYVNLDLSVYASLDFCSPTGTALCYGTYLREVGAYFEGVADVKGTFKLDNPMLASSSTANLVPKARAGSLTFSVAGLPLTVYLYFEVNVDVSATGSVKGKMSYAASYYQQVDFGAAYNYKKANSNTIYPISQFGSATTSAPPADFSGILDSDAQVEVSLRPKAYAALWDIVSVYAQVSPRVSLTTTKSGASCQGLSVSVKMDVSCMLGMDALTWASILAATGMTSWSSYLYGTIIQAYSLPSFSVISPMDILTPLCIVAPSATPSPTSTKSLSSSSTPSPTSTKSLSSSVRTFESASPSSTPAGAGSATPSNSLVPTSSSCTVYVADLDNNAVWKIVGTSAPVSVGSGFLHPLGVFVAPSGDIFVGDFGNNAVKKIPGGTGVPVAIGGGFSLPIGVFVTDSGDVYVGDFGNDKVKKIPGGTGSPVSIGSGFNKPCGLYVTVSGDVYVADSGNNAVKKIPGGVGVPVSIGSGFNAPCGVFVTPSGDVYVADSSNNAVKMIPGGTGVPVTIGSGYNYPYGVFVTPSGDVYVADAGNNAVKKIPGGTGLPVLIGGGFNRPSSVYVDCISFSSPLSSTPSASATPLPAPFVLPDAQAWAPLALLRYGQQLCYVGVNGCVSCPVYVCGGAAAPPVTSSPIVALTGAVGDGCHTFALRADGTAAGWGSDGEGRVSGISTSTQWRSVAAGGHCTYALTAEGTMEAAGYNFLRQCVAQSGTFSAVWPSYVGACATSLAGGLLSCWGEGHSEPVGSAVASFSRGDKNWCALAVDGTVSCGGWGGLAPPSPPVKLRQVAVDHSGSPNACGITAAWEVQCWGAGVAGWATLPPSGKLVFLTNGESTFCGVRFDQSVVCWGAASAAIKAAVSGISVRLPAALASLDPGLAGLRTEPYAQCVQPSATPSFNPPSSFTPNAASSATPVTLTGLCSSLQLSASSTSCQGPAWMTFMPAITEMSALDAAGRNAAASASGGVASADSATDDCGCGCCSPQTPARTAQIAANAIDGSLGTSWQAKGVGGYGCVTCTCSSSPWLTVSFPGAAVAVLGLNLSRSGQGGAPFAPDLASDIASMAVWTLQLKTQAGSTAWSGTFSAAASVVTSPTSAYWSWVLPPGTCGALSTGSSSPTPSVTPSEPASLTSTATATASASTTASLTPTLTPSATSSPSCDVYVASGGSVVKFPGGTGTPVIFGSGYSVGYNMIMTQPGDVYVADVDGNAIKKIPAGGGAAVTVVSGLNLPQGVFVTASGDVFVADTGNNMVKKFPGGSGTPVIIASGLNHPQSVFVTTSGDVYVSEFGNNAVKKYPGGTGTPVTIGSGFNSPQGLFVTPSGDVYVADRGNDAIKKIPGGTGTPVTVGSGFHAPGSVFVTSSGDVYVADTYNQQVKKIPGGSGTPVVVGGSYVFTWPSAVFVTCGGTPPSTATISTTNTDTSTGTHTSTSTISTTNTGTSTSTVSLSISASATPIPCPSSYYCVSGEPVLCPAGSFCPFSSLNPTPCPAGTFSSTTGAASNATCLRCPAGAFCAAGCAAPTPCAAGYYGATAGLAVPTCSGLCTAGPGYGCAAGSISPANATLCPVGFFCPGGTPAPAAPCYPATACPVLGLTAQPTCYWNSSTLVSDLYLPYNVRVNASGVLFIGDTYSVMQVNLAATNTQLSTFVGSGTTGFADGRGTAVSFTGVTGLATAPGLVYISDIFSNTIRRANTGGDVTTFVAPEQGLHRPYGLAVFSTGVLAVADNSGAYVRLVTPSGLMTTLAGCGQQFFSPGIGTQACFEHPSALTYVPDQTLFLVASSGLVLKVGTQGEVSVFAGSTSSGFADGQGTSALFDSPVDISYAFGGLFIADRNNHKIRAVSLAGMVSTVAGDGFGAGFYNTGRHVEGLGVFASFNGPFGLDFDLNGVMYVADTNNRRVRSLTCVPCPASYYCSSGMPLRCPAGSYCPLGSTYATLCPKGTFSSSGSTSCTLCAAGLYNPTAGASSSAACLPCQSAMTAGAVGCYPTDIIVSSQSATASMQASSLPMTASARPAATATPLLSSRPTASSPPTGTATLSASLSSTPTPTATTSATPTSSGSGTGSASSTGTSSGTPTSSPTSSSTLSLSSTTTPSVSSSPTPSLSPGSSASATGTLSLSVSESATPSGSVTPTGTPTGSGTESGTASPTASSTPASTPSTTSTVTASPSSSKSVTASRTATPTTSPSLGASGSVSPSAAITPSNTPPRTKSASRTATATASGTGTGSSTGSGSTTGTGTPTATPTTTQSASDTSSATSSLSATPTATLSTAASPSATSSLSHSASVTASASASSSPSASSTPPVSTSPTPSLTGTPSATVTLSSTGTATASLTTSRTPTVTPSKGATPSGTPSGTASPTVTGTRTPSATLSPSRTGTRSPTTSPTLSRLASPSRTASRTPSSTGTGSLTATRSGTRTSSRTPTSSLTLGVTPSRTSSESRYPSDSPSNRRSPTNTPTPSVTPVASAVTPSVTPSLTSSPSAISQTLLRITLQVVLPIELPVSIAELFLQLIITALQLTPPPTMRRIDHSPAATGFLYNFTLHVEVGSGTTYEGRRLGSAGSTLSSSVDASDLMSSVLTDGTMLTALADAGLAGSMGYAAPEDLMAAIAPPDAAVVNPSSSTTPSATPSPTPTPTSSLTAGASPSVTPSPSPTSSALASVPPGALSAAGGTEGSPSGMVPVSSVVVLGVLLTVALAALAWRTGLLRKGTAKVAPLPPAPPHEAASIVIVPAVEQAPPPPPPLSSPVRFPQFSTESSSAGEEGAAQAEESAAAAVQAEAAWEQAERLEAEQAERLEAARLKVAQLKLKVAQREANRLDEELAEKASAEAEAAAAEAAEAAETAEAERRKAERQLAEQAAAERREQELQEAQRLEAERLEAARVEAERLEAARLEAARVEAAQAEAARVEAERVEAARLEAARKQREFEEQEAMQQRLREQAAAQREEAAITHARALVQALTDSLPVSSLSVSHRTLHPHTLHPTEAVHAALQCLQFHLKRTGQEGCKAALVSGVVEALLAAVGAYRSLGAALEGASAAVSDEELEGRIQEARRAHRPKEALLEQVEEELQCGTKVDKARVQLVTREAANTQNALDALLDEQAKRQAALLQVQADAADAVGVIEAALACMAAVVEGGGEAAAWALKRAEAYASVKSLERSGLAVRVPKGGGYASLTDALQRLCK